MNEEILFNIGQEVWVVFPDDRKIKYGMVLQVVIQLDASSRTVLYTLSNADRTYFANEENIYADKTAALDALSLVIGYLYDDNSSKF